MSNICSYIPDPNILTQAKVNKEFSMIHKHLCYVESALTNVSSIENDTAAAPSTSSFVGTSMFGTNSHLLGTPKAWGSITVNGTDYKIPLY